LSSSSPGKSPQALLDADAPGTVRLSAADAAAMAVAAIQRIGYSEADSRVIADQLVDNALCGYRFAGLPRILTIAAAAQTRGPRREIQVVSESLLGVTLDGGNNVGYVAVYRAAEMAAHKAAQTGFCAAGVYNSYYSGRNAYYAEMLARQGFVVFHAASGEPRVLPLGGTRPALGTNPICFAFPSKDGPVVVDLGTASVMMGDLHYHARVGKPLPPGVAVDAAGNPTEDAAAALDGGILPFGGHKGFGLSFAVQALGLLAGAQRARGNVQDFGFLFWVIKPEVMMPDGDFAAQMSALIDRIQATPRQPGCEEIRIPSQRAHRERERRRVEGIVLERTIIEAIQAL
jgi:LDH2 family malate/lactate/ureidoglycolate dehydrogenase